VKSHKIFTNILNESKFVLIPFLVTVLNLNIFITVATAQVSVLLQPKNIFALAFSPDGKVITTGHGDGKIRSWGINTKNHLSTLSGHSFPVISLAYSPDGNLLVTGGMDKNLKLWDVNTGNNILTFSEKLKSKNFYQVAISPSGKILASGDGNMIRLWNIYSGELIRTLNGHSSDVFSLAFSPDGNFLASGSLNKTVKTWKVSTGKNLSSFTGHSKAVTSLAYSPNGMFLTSSSSDKTIKIWNTKTSRLLKILNGHSNSISTLAFNPNGMTLVSGSWDGSIKLWNTINWNNTLTINGHSNLINAVSYHPDGRTFASASTDGTIKHWEDISGKLIHTFSLKSRHLAEKSKGFKENDAWINKLGRPLENIALGKLVSYAYENIIVPFSSYDHAVAYSPDGKAFAAIGKGKTLMVWKKHTGQQIYSIPFKANSLAFNPTGQSIAIAGDNKSIMLFDLTKGKPYRLIYAHTKMIVSIAYHPNGKTLATASRDNTIKFWNVETGRRLRTIKNGIEGIKTLTFSPDGTTLASAGKDKAIKLWDTKTGKLIKTFTGHLKNINSIAFSPNGLTLASGSNDASVKLWEVQSGEIIHSLKLKANLVNSVAFSPDGLTLASGHWDETIKIIDTKTGKTLRTLKGHTSTVNSVAFSPDGNLLISGEGNKTLKVWETKMGENIFSLSDDTNEVNREKTSLEKFPSNATNNFPEQEIQNNRQPKTPNQTQVVSASSQSKINAEPQVNIENFKFINFISKKDINHKALVKSSWVNFKLPAYDFLVLTQVPLNWHLKPYYEKKDGKITTMYFLPKDQTPKKWTENIKMFALSKPGVSLRQIFDGVHAGIIKSCGKESTAAQLIKESTSEIVALFLCGKHSKDDATIKEGSGQIIVQRFYKEKEMLFSISHSWLGKTFNVKKIVEKNLPATKKDLARYIKASNSTEICDNNNLEGSCAIANGVIVQYLSEKLTNTSALRNLHPFNPIICEKLDKLTNKHTPADIYQGVTKCLQQGRYGDAVNLHALAGAYATFDTMRVTDRSAHNARLKLLIRSLGSEKKTQELFNKELKKTFSEKENLKEVCRKIINLGAPDYYPTYMIQHGLRAIRENDGKNNLATEFDSDAAWKDSLVKFLHCPKN
jgi:WD40 repeat protein